MPFAYSKPSFGSVAFATPRSEVNLQPFFRSFVPPRCPSPLLRITPLWLLITCKLTKRHQKCVSYPIGGRGIFVSDKFAGVDSDFECPKLAHVARWSRIVI